MCRDKGTHGKKVEGSGTRRDATRAQLGIGLAGDVADAGGVGGA